jgi:hypothetical protein
MIPPLLLRCPRTPDGTWQVVLCNLFDLVISPSAYILVPGLKPFAVQQQQNKSFHYLESLLDIIQAPGPSYEIQAVSELTTNFNAVLCHLVISTGLAVCLLVFLNA